MKRKKDLFTRKVFQTKHRFVVLLFFFLFDVTFSGWAQHFDDENITATLQKIDSMDDAVKQKLAFCSPRLKSTNAGTLVLDSVYETVNHGVYTDHSRHYFNYDTNRKLSSSEKYFFDDTGTYSTSAEYQTYNSDGQVVSLVKKKTFYAGGSPDTTIILYEEQNSYSDGKLSEKRIYSIGHYNYSNYGGVTYFNIFSSSSYTNYFEYNSDGQLVHEYSTTNSWSNPDFYYYYNDDGLLVYKYNPSQILKYDYETNEDVLIKAEKMYYSSLDNNPEVFDTITRWSTITYDEMTYETSGRIATLRNSIYFYDQNYSLVLMRFNFKAEFAYNEGNQPVHASYYSYADQEDSTSYYELTRIDYTYDEEGNLLEHHKTFFDARVERWVTHTRTNYYYSADKSGEIKSNDDNMAGISIYPNPVRNVVNMSFPSGFHGTYSIISSTGKTMIKTKPLIPAIDISNLNRGFYLICIEHEGKFETLRFVKE
ncbi:MAG TPA: T9SS type A sorting domain-containing protein [Prolixibacteraceae bacterium]|nr:T9SS type A sorting domain-containing protein [Prolixibacteraceae bacterium]